MMLERLFVFVKGILLLAFFLGIPDNVTARTQPAVPNFGPIAGKITTFFFSVFGLCAFRHGNIFISSSCIFEFKHVFEAMEKTKLTFFGEFMEYKFPKLFFLQLFPEQFHKGFSLFVKLNCNCLCWS